MKFTSFTSEIEKCLNTPTLELPCHTMGIFHNGDKSTT